MAETEDNVELPGKLVNQKKIPTIGPLAVSLNAFGINLDKAVPEVHQFELKFVGVSKGKSEAKSLEVGPKNDVAKETRRRLLWQLYQLMLNKHPQLFGKDHRIHCFDCALIFYSTKTLGSEIGSEQKFELEYDEYKNELEQRSLSYIKRFERIQVSLLRTGTVNLRNARAAYIQGDRSVVQFLEILTSQQLYREKLHHCFGNRMYEAQSRIRMQDDPRIMKKGMQKNVRFVGENQTNALPILQLDPKKSAFFPGIGLLQFIAEFVQLEPAGLERKWQDLLDKINKQIRGLVLVTTHLDPARQITFANQGLINETAKEKTFERDGRQVTVENYFREAHQVNLRFPNLPCILQRTPQKESYYPVEVLQIVDGQRVPIEKHTPRLVEQMIRQCQVLPVDLPAQIKEQCNKADASDFLRAHAIRVEDELMKAEAQQLYQPAIVYQRNDKVEPEPQRGLSNWRMIGRDVDPGRRYLLPATFPRIWTVVIVQKCVARDPCQRFCERFVQTAKARGLEDCAMPPRLDFYERTDCTFVREKFKFYAQNRCKFVLFFAPGKRSAFAGDMHHMMKLMEKEYGVITQHVSPEIMAKGTSGGGGAAMVLENILMKTNLKLGGVNHALATSEIYKRASRNQEDIVSNQWLNGKRMFIGIDFSHAPPQNLFERQTGQAPTTPTVVGMSWTTGKMMLKMRGTYWYQQARVATMHRQHVQPFVDNIKIALDNYHAENGHFPDHIIVFRGGASEGEFKKVSYWEGGAFTQAFEEISATQKEGFRPPAVTIVVCQRQSNYRVIPERINRNAKAPDQNVPPGTVVDQGAMNAALTEFLLVAHRALQGTAQPVRCTVVFEWRPPKTGSASNHELQMPLEEIENITHALCYSHGIFTGSTVVPGVLYSSSELAKRGRNNWRTNTMDGNAGPITQFNVPSPALNGEEYARAMKQLDEQLAAYFNQMSRRMEPPTAFWK